MMEAGLEVQPVDVKNISFFDEVQPLIYDGEKLLDEPFLDIRDQVTTKGSEQGLLGLAFHPNFQENGALFSMM